MRPGVLVLGTDNGSQFTSRDFRKHLSARGVTHRRGGYRDPESQAFIESWFGQFKKRCAWRSEWETIEQAREEITAYIDTYHHRPHSGLAYRTPAEVATTWRDMTDLQTEAVLTDRPAYLQQLAGTWTLGRQNMAFRKPVSDRSGSTIAFVGSPETVSTPRHPWA